MIVRKMLPEEMDVTLNLFGYYRDEAIESMPRIADEYDENSVLGTIRKYASNWSYCWFNMYDNTRPVGFIAGYASACPWNEDILVANVGFLYLLESHRNMDNFKQLFKSFEEWAKNIHATQMTAGDIGINLERSQKLYEHLGFKPILFTVKDIE